MDPLHLLRTFTTSGKLDEVSLEDNNIKFGSSYSFPRSTKLVYRKNKGKDEPYTLEAIVFFVKHLDMVVSAYAQYRTKAREMGVGEVAVLDRLDLAGFLQGKTEGPEHLKSAPAIVDATAEVEEQGGQGGGQRGAEGGSAAEAAEVAVLRGIQAHERPIRDRVSVLRCPRKSLSKVLDQAVRVGLASQEARKRYLASLAAGASVSAQERAGSRAAAAGPSGGGGVVKRASDVMGIPKTGPRPEKQARKGPADAIPIIVVPQGVQARLGVFNAKEFLETGKYVDLQEARKAQGGRKSKVVLVRRTTKREEPVSYHVVEEFPKAVADQERVAACFVQGARWQFKGWPIPGVDRGDMVECFHRICGFYLRFNDEKVPQEVKTWNVKVLTLNRANRYEDAAVALQFWDALDDFITRSARLRETLKF